MPGACLILTFVAVAAGHEIPTDPEVLAEAEAAFHAGVEKRATPADARKFFLQAIERYELLCRRGVGRAAVHGNLGNAYVLTGDVPKAILAYRRAQRFAPSDRGVQEGLAFARNQVSYPSGGTFGRPPVDQRPPWLPRVNSAWYLSFGFFFYYLGWLAVRCWCTGHSGRWLLWAAATFSLALLLVGALVAEEWRDAGFTNRPVVVLSDDGVLLRMGNGLSYPPRSEIPLNRGVEARLLFVRGDWLQIELGGGEIGWIPRDYALIDEPAK